MFDFLWNDLLLNPMINALIVLSNVLFDNYGLAIVAFTLLTRFATYPLTLRQLRTTRAMSEMQPRLKEIQKKYKDPRRRQEEMMKLYREVGFNPLGCVGPLVVQMPIWIALFQVIRRTLGTSPENLFGLSSRLYDWDIVVEAVPLNQNFLFLDLADPSVPLALLVAISAFVQQKFMTGRAPARDDRQRSMNRTMLWMMPLIFGWFTLTVPSGLGLYWLVTNLFGIGAAYLYNGPENFHWRALLNLEPMPYTPQPTAQERRRDGQPAVESAAEQPQPAEGDVVTPDGEGRRRRRRRRRRRSRTTQAGKG